jgi:TolB-like protein/DNA-binding winged helix-turn-helix (wHTH) protein/Tfp pilus assembly protein PilF
LTLPDSKSAVLAFGAFELRQHSGELRKEGRLIRLQPQPLRVLALLAGRAGELVTREEIRKEIWGQDTFVDFEQGLNYCIKEIRATLGDDAETPQYVETLPRRGYRFIAPVKHIETPAPAMATVQDGTASLPAARPRYRLALLGLAAVLVVAAVFAWQRFRPAAAPSGKIMLAVLPFENLSGDTEQDYLSDGLTDEMITQLARLNPERLGVIARTSAMHYKGARKDVREVGRELGVDYVLEGSLRRDGDRVRISAQLIQVKDQTHLWAENYERHVRDILAVQDNVARAIAAEIRVQLTPQGLAAAGRGSSARAAAPEVYQLYLKGRYFWNKRTEAGHVKAIQSFQEAIQKDPDSAPAYAGLADAYALLGSMTNSTLPRLEAMPRARAFAEKALALDESLAEAHTSLAFVKMHFEQDWATAEKEFQRAIALNPSYVTAHHWYAYCLISQGRVEEALREIRLAQELDPLSLIINTDLGELLYFARRYDEAIRQAQKTLEMDSSFALAHRVLGWGYEQKGMYKESIAELQTLVRLSGRADYALAALGRSYALSGNRKEAEKLLRELRALYPRKPGTSFGLAVLYSALGNKDQAFFWLEKSAQERFGIILIKVEPYFDSLRTDPRFRDIERRMALTPD